MLTEPSTGISLSFLNSLKLEKPEPLPANRDIHVIATQHPNHYPEGCVVKLPQIPDKYFALVHKNWIQF